ncbi:MAG: proprotein convertase P-domain-containing protein [Planctomycetota bacterium]
MLLRRALIGLSLALFPAAFACGQQTLSHSQSQAIGTANSITCLDNASPVPAHHATSFWRTFDLAGFGIGTAICVEGVEFGIQTVTSCNEQPLIVRLYVDDDPDPAPLNDLLLVAEKAITVSNNASGIVFADIAAEIASGSTLVVELHSPAGQPTLGYFLPGSNNLGETAPGYLSAAACGFPEPVQLGSLGANGANMHLVMNVRYNLGGCNCIAPTALIANQLGNSQSIELQWVNQAPPQGYDLIEVFVDGSLHATLPGTATDYTVFSAASFAQTVQLEVRSVAMGTPCEGRASTHTVLVGTPLPLSGGVSHTSTPAASLAAAGGSVSDTIQVASVFPVDGIQVGVDISHNKMSDLIVTLAAPNGSSVTLHSNSFFQGGFLQPDLQLTYHDLGVAACDVSSTCGCLVRPSGPGLLDDLRCGTSSGTWTLTVTDLLGQPTGTLNSWTLDLNDGICCRAPSDLIAGQNCIGGSLTLTWTNNDNYDFIRISDEHNGNTVITQLPGTTTSHTFTAAPTGLHRLTLLGQCASGLVLSAAIETDVYHTDGTETDIVLALEGLQSMSGLGTIDSGAALQQALLANGRNPLIVRATPGEFPCMNHVDVVWVVSGTFPNDYRLSQSEGDLLAALNESGPGIYFESADHWGFQHVPSLLDTRDGIAAANNGDDSFTRMDGFDTANGIDLSGLLGVSYTQDYHLSDDNDQLIPAQSSSAGTSHVLWRNHPDSAVETDYVTGVFRDNAVGGNMVSCSWEFGGYGADAATLAAHYLGVLIGESQFVRGDCNGDGSTDIGDVVFLLNYLFPTSQNVTVLCLDACDANDSGILNLADAVHILWALLVPQSGVTIPPPVTCGVDPTPSALSCLQSPGCP